VIVVRRTSTATPQDVWRVLADPWRFAAWVVGAAGVDDADERWPAQGARMRYRVGAWPVLFPATSEVTGSTAGAELALRGDLGAGGAVELVLRLHDDPPGTRIAIAEDVVAGPARLLPRRVRAAVISARNRETLRRLALLAEHART
jgi:uncharacterized protein YndB with AHSA1/START domain